MKRSVDGIEYYFWDCKCFYIVAGATAFLLFPLAQGYTQRDWGVQKEPILEVWVFTRPMNFVEEKGSGL